MFYDTNKSFQENRDYLKKYSFTPSPMPLYVEDPKYTFMGFPLQSLVGVAACPLTASVNSIAACWDWGFSLVTYKTVCRNPQSAHPFPHVTHVVSKMLHPSDVGGVVYATHVLPHDNKSIALANSIGNASYGIASESAAIAGARSVAKSGQLLAVSVYGGGENCNQSFENDFIYTACAAQSAGAHIIEANFSCPNVQGTVIYENPDVVFRVTRKLVRALGTTPLLVKIGFIADIQLLRQIVCSIARAGAAGIVGINSVPMRVVDAQQKPFFGQRRIAGVSGKSIFSLACSFVRNVSEIIVQEKLDIALCGVGGVITAFDVDQMLHAGANVVLSATGVMHNLGLAYEYRTTQQRK